jgi:hypothetical protein
MGGLLDKHRGETGLATIIRPEQTTDLLRGIDPLGPLPAAGLPLFQQDLLQLAAESNANPRGALVGIDSQIVEEAADQAAVGASVQIIATWGSGKGRASAIIDTRLGGQVVLSGNVVNIAVRYVLEGTPGFDGPTVRVSANASYGDRPGGNASLTFTTLSTGPLAVAAVSGFYPIPSYATRVQWVSPNDPNAFVAPAATLEFSQTPGAFAAGFVLAAPPANEFVAIPNGATNLRIFNNGALNNQYRLIYELGL